jgi:hypothetical protein
MSAAKRFNQRFGKIGAEVLPKEIFKNDRFFKNPFDWPSAIEHCIG